MGKVCFTEKTAVPANGQAVMHAVQAATEQLTALQDTSATSLQHHVFSTVITGTASNTINRYLLTT